MKHLKLFFPAILLLTASIVKAQNQNISKDLKPTIQQQKNCCPDTSSMSGVPGNFVNSHLAIENPGISKNATTGNYTFKATIANHGDDCSYCTQVIVLLPPTVKLLKYSAKTRKGKALNITRCYGVLIIDAGMMCPGPDSANYFQQFTVTVETTDHNDGGKDAGFAIMVYSKIPDLNQADNYWYGRK